MGLLKRGGVVAAWASALVLLGCGSGKDGTPGSPGSPGSAGAAGLSSVVRTSSAPASVCPAGGIVIEGGHDTNGNGVLDAAEVNAALTVTICNGATGATGATGGTGATGAPGTPGAPGAPGTPGAPGANGTNGLTTLVHTSDAVDPAVCPQGGVLIEVGLDANGNGVLDAGEVNPALTQSVCNGLTPTPQPSAIATVSYGPAMVIDATAGETSFVIDVTDGLDFSIDGVIPPAIIPDQIRVTIRNRTAGALGNATWAASFLMASWEQPGSDKERTITFEFYPATFEWIEVARTPVDVPAPAF
jgi:hypothetical protein